MGLYRVHVAHSPYPRSATPDLDHVQTADVLYTAHNNYRPQKCIRYGHTDWRWSRLTFGPVIDPPTGHSVAATTPNTTGYVDTTYKYVITAVKDTPPVQESRQSSVVQVNNDLSLSGNYNTITVPAPSGDVSRHIIYKEQGGIYGYIGATEGTSFRDQNIQPILSETPPKAENPFDALGNYPGVIGLHQQRLLFGGTKNVINGVWGSRSADLENMDRARPARADDSFAFALMAEKVNAVTDLLSSDELLVFSTDAVWAIQGGDGGVLTPGEINPKVSSRRGARKVKPVSVDGVTFFVPSKASLLRALGYTFEIEGYKSDNVSIFSPHLFAGREIIRIAYQEEPFSAVWALRDDGVLLCLTWQVEQDVWGWSVIERPAAAVLDIAVITEGGYDRLYALVRRRINGVAHHFLERMALPHVDDITTANHLDCSITQVFDPPQNRITGLWHLEGATVSATWDGYAAHDLVVQNGAVELPDGAEGTIVTVGLPYEAVAETLPAALTNGEGSAHVNRQQIGDVVVRTIDTRGISIGVSGSDLMQQVEPKDGTDVSDLMDVDAIDYRVPVPGDWKDTSTIIVKQTEPLPAHIVGIFPTQLVSEE